MKIFQKIRRILIRIKIPLKAHSTFRVETYGLTKKHKFPRKAPACQFVTWFFSRLGDSVLFFQSTESSSVLGGSGWNMGEAEAAKMQSVMNMLQYHLPAGLSCTQGGIVRFVIAPLSLLGVVLL